MDDIFDNLIFIIITIVAFAISALGKKKKKQPQVPPVRAFGEKQQEEEKRTIFPNLEQLIREEMGLENKDLYEDYEDDEVNNQEEVVEQPLDSVPPEMLDDVPDTPYSIEYDNKDLIDEESISDSDLTHEEVVAENEDEEFDLQKAVIYSEILNRKEY